MSLRLLHPAATFPLPSPSSMACCSTTNHGFKVSQPIPPFLSHLLIHLPLFMSDLDPLTHRVIRSATHPLTSPNSKPNRPNTKPKTHLSHALNTIPQAGLLIRALTPISDPLMLDPNLLPTQMENLNAKFVQNLVMLPRRVIFAMTPIHHTVASRLTTKLMLHNRKPPPLLFRMGFGLGRHQPCHQ